MNAMTANEVWDAAIEIAREQVTKPYSNFLKITTQYGQSQESELEYAAYESAQVIFRKLREARAAQEGPM